VWAKEPAIRGRTIHQIAKEIYKEFNDLVLRYHIRRGILHIKAILKKNNFH